MFSEATLCVEKCQSVHVHSKYNIDEYYNLYKVFFFYKRGTGT